MRLGFRKEGQSSQEMQVAGARRLDSARHFRRNFFGASGVCTFDGFGDGLSREFEPEVQIVGVFSEEQASKLLKDGNAPKGRDEQGKI